MVSRILLFVLVLAGSDFLVSSSACQEISSFEISSSLNHQTGHYSFAGNGRLRTGYSQTIANANALFFEDETIQNELELVESQQSDYDSAVKHWQESWLETIKEVQRQHAIKKRSREFTLEMIWENDEKNLESLKEILLPHQIAIINELQFRCLFRTHGLKELLKNEKLRKMLALSDGERKALGVKTLELKKKLINESKAAIEGAIKTLIESLADADKERFLRRWEHLFSPKNGISIEELLVFLDADSFEWIQDDSEPLKKLLKRPRFQTGPAGNLQTLPGPKYRNVEINIFRTFWSNAEFKEFLALNETDEQQVFEFLKNSYPSTMLMNIPANDKARLEQAYKEADDREQKGLSNIKRVLGNEGWKQVEAYANQTNIKSAGLVYDLLDGEFGEQLELTERKQKQLLDSARKARKNLVKQSQEMEQDFLDGLIDAVDDESKKKMQEIFGRSVEKAPSNIGLLLMMQ